jgi:hypothetical protein
VPCGLGSLRAQKKGQGVGSLLAKSSDRHKRCLMSTVEIIASEVRELEPKQQSQVLRFLQALRKEKELNEEKAFKDFSFASAMRGMEDEPDLYSEEALGR